MRTPPNPVAYMLGVSRRRAQVFVEENLLTGYMVGASRVRRHVAGKPLTPDHAWRVIAGLNPRDIEQLDADRRRVRTRAEHHPWYVHPSVVKRIRNTHDRRRVLSGSDAAAAHDVPVGGPNELLHVYIRASDRLQLEDEARPEARSPSTANVIVHGVPDADWPFHGDTLPDSMSHGWTWPTTANAGNVWCSTNGGAADERN